MFEVGILLLVLVWKFGPTLSGLSYDRLDETLLRYEGRHGRLFWIVQLSFLLIIAACFYSRIDTCCAYLGGHFARLAANPFAFESDNPVSYRLLTPLISYCIGLRRGCTITLTNLMIAGVMIGFVYSYYRKAAPRPGDAFLAVVTLTFSLVILTTVHCGGYCDVFTYLIIFLMWRYRTKRSVFHLLFLLGLLNRESIAFLLPWFVFISLQSTTSKGTRVLDLLVGFGLTLGAYWFFRQWVASHQEVRYSLAYYLEPFLKDPLGMFRQTFYYHGLGFFSVFKLLWIFPALAVASWWKQKNYGQLVNVFLLVFCAWAQLFMAGDTSRMFTLGFMVMIVSLHHLFDTNCFRFREWAFWLVLFNLMVPQVFTAGSKIEVWQSLMAYLLTMLW